MHIHILGIGGTFMGGLAAIAQAKGHKVTGQDKKLYPPMSTQLDNLGIEVQEYSPHALPDNEAVDMVIVGNVMSRGKEVVEALLNRQLPYTSGPQWLAEHILNDRHVLAVSGTHGKTTTSSMLAWILEYAGLAPGFLIGGVPKNFSESARLGKGDYFVVEADEYDSAFFDKRSKFVHYRPTTLIVNNMEFDHADIFSNLAAIQRQFHHLIRTVPGQGLVIHNQSDKNVLAMLEMGCWSKQQLCEQVNWKLIGEHNVMNGLAAIAAAHHAGVKIDLACHALHAFHGVKRRLELISERPLVNVYDDFAHHPTAIETTLQGLRNRYPNDQIIAIFDPNSNTMKRGEHNEVLAASFALADKIWTYQHVHLKWNLTDVFASILGKTHVVSDANVIVKDVVENLSSNVKTHIVIMSNGGFAGLRESLKSAIDELI